MESAPVSQVVFYFTRAVSFSHASAHRRHASPHSRMLTSSGIAAHDASQARQISKHAAVMAS
jgi:hypothetical protein